MTDTRESDRSHGSAGRGGWTVDRWTRVSIAFLIAVALAIGIRATLAVGSGAPGEIVGGDYPAFYGAGSIALDGDWESLYDIERQAEAQAGLHDDDGDVWYFAYPPQVAALYAPLALMPYALSYLVHTALMAGALLGAILLARPMVPWLHGREAIAMAAAMAFWPMFRAVTGGSNTALVVLLVVASWRFITDGHPGYGGLAASLLLFKPTFAVPLLGLHLVARNWRVVAGAAAGVAAFALSGIGLLGVGWLGTWLDAALDFGAIDAEVNGHSAISVVGFAENLAGAGSSPMIVLAWVLASCAVAALCWVWWIADRERMGVALAITMPGILFLSLHAMSHDGGVLVLTAAIAAATWSAGSWRPWVAALWTLGAATAFIADLGFSPGFVGLLVALAWVAIPVRDRGRWLRTSDLG